MPNCHAFGMLLSAAVLNASLHGCAALPISATQMHGSTSADQVSSLAGASKEEVIRTIGPPRYELTGATGNSWFIYVASGEIDALFSVIPPVPAPVPAAMVQGDKETLHCLVMKFNAEAQLTLYQRDWAALRNTANPETYCLGLIPDKEGLKPNDMRRLNNSGNGD